MKQIIIKFVIFGALIILIDHVFWGVLLQLRPPDYQAFISAKEEYFEEEEQYDLLLIGDSHISDALNSQIMEEQCQLSTFNLGIFLATPYETYRTLKYAIEQKGDLPQKIIYGTNSVMFTTQPLPGRYTPLIVDDFQFTLEAYLQAENPHYTSLFFKTAREKYLSKALFNKITGKKVKPAREIENPYHGFMEIRNQIDGTNWDGVPAIQKPVNKKQVAYFAKVIELAQENDIELYIVNPPIWWTQLATIEQTPNFRDFQNIIDSLATQYQVPVHNLDHHFMEEELVFEDFLNHEHLNYYGSLKYTPHIAEWLNSFE
jgi:hypothetical protein